MKIPGEVSKRWAIIIIDWLVKTRSNQALTMSDPSYLGIYKNFPPLQKKSCINPCVCNVGSVGNATSRLAHVTNPRAKTLNFSQDYSVDSS
jgi:hypothetical protein